MTNELKHYGILGMKWGVRNYQNKDGTLTPAGERRYLKNPNGFVTRNNLSKSGEKLRKIVINQAEKNTDLRNEYDDSYRKFSSTDTNEHARSIINKLTRTWREYEKAQKAYEKSGTEQDKKRAEKLLRDYDDLEGMLKYANIRDNDALYEQFIDSLSDRVLTQLGSEVTIYGKHFVSNLIGDYYKHELDY